MYNSIGVVLSKLSLKMCNCALIKTQDLCYYPVVGFPNWHVEGGFLIVPPNFQYQNEKQWATNQIFCSMNSRCATRSSLAQQRNSF